MKIKLFPTTNAQDVNTQGRLKITRKKPSFDGRQQVTRIPPYRPGDWVKLKEMSGADERTWGLSGRPQRVRSITCSITDAEQRRPIWRVHFENGRSVEWHMIDRLATEREVRAS